LALSETVRTWRRKRADVEPVEAPDVVLARPAVLEAVRLSMQVGRLARYAAAAARAMAVRVPALVRRMAAVLDRGARGRGRARRRPAAASLLLLLARIRLVERGDLVELEREAQEEEPWRSERGPFDLYQRRARTDLLLDQGRLLLLHLL
jgi:hypothetical protein